MAFNFQDRLKFSNARFKEINGETVDYIAKDGTTVIGITASPILQEAEEITPSVAVTRLEIQEWVIDFVDLGFLPQIADRIIRANGDIFTVTSMGADEAAFKFVTSNRERFIIRTKRLKD